ncbi:helix-turn-helix transcriptional regulator [Alicyclobacillus mali]|uniref:Helix-turn-helix transcriptional regulator n=1 Tax=Alicyclobacillus mali (ex Roth et al. 2021) TaxID=1123961 RepID=A0ABS0F5E3_9BACL|nr:helix-turn-helix transcriptional regulator [Alicyclobacillus mali (ex Roth et al. 2021)]MBF8378516.1 helix-turn-helix transcriptional regulator [Alicyclobacillus mali (ex Roth et al. 2021)]
MFGERLERLRIQQGLSQDQLAEAVGLTRAAVSHYEKGRRRPDFDTVRKLADFFHVSTDYLLGLTDQPLPQAESKIEVFARRLRESRIKQGLDIREIADRLKVSEAYVRGLEEQPLRYPGVTTLNRLAELLGVTSAYLVGDTNDPKDPGPYNAWYQPKDLIRFLDESDVMFEGQPLDDDDKARIKEILAAIFRDARKRNRRRKEM